MDRYFWVKVPRRKGVEERVKSACRLGAGSGAQSFYIRCTELLGFGASTLLVDRPSPRPQAEGCLPSGHLLGPVLPSALCLPSGQPVLIAAPVLCPRPSVLT